METRPTWEYCTVEWLWNEGTIRLNGSDGSEISNPGSYAEVPQALTQLGRQGWEVVTCVGVENWLFWTLKRRI